MPRLTRPIADRFWEKVRKGEACWLWTGGTDSNGYGRIGLGGGSLVRVNTHRLSYELHFGPIPTGLNVLHSCDTPRCVNPAHLSLGTHADNVRDKCAKGRQAKGERMGAAKLNEHSVIEIRRRLRGGESQQALAREFHVTAPAVGMIARGRAWRHVA